MELTLRDITTRRADFEAAGIRLPRFDIDAVRKAGAAAPVWLHIGPGNLFKAFHAALAQRLLEEGCTDRGIIAAAPNDYEALAKAYLAHDNLILRVVMKAGGGLEKEVLAPVTEALTMNPDSGGWRRLKEIFRAPSLQMVSLTITEKGYGLRALDGSFKPETLRDFEDGPAAPRHTITRLCALLHERWLAGGTPLALLSTDNFSRNGDRFREAVLEAAAEWEKRGHTETAFTAYLADTSKTAFPLSMIDKITPYPSARVSEALAGAGLTGIEPVRTSRGSLAAPFVNTEEAEYLVVEDRFPNGRPPLERAGVYFTDPETVDRVDRMKVCACLNPLHTALAVFGCLLGYKSIAEEMKDGDLALLVRKIGYDEGLPVVLDPGIISPAAFLAETLEKRFPNPAIPDTPQRIASDTSQKLRPRFGETIRAYTADGGPGPDKLTFIPLTIAAWCRYLLALDDEGGTFTPSPDPLLEELQRLLAGIALGKPASAEGKLKTLLSNEKIFGTNLYDAGLGTRIEGYFGEFLAGPGAVRKTLRKYLGRSEA